MDRPRVTASENPEAGMPRKRAVAFEIYHPVVRKRRQQPWPQFRGNPAVKGRVEKDHVESFSIRTVGNEF